MKTFLKYCSQLQIMILFQYFYYDLKISGESRTSHPIMLRYYHHNWIDLFFFCKCIAGCLQMASSSHYIRWGKTCKFLLSSAFMIKKPKEATEQKKKACQVHPHIIPQVTDRNCKQQFEIIVSNLRKDQNKIIAK